MNLAYTNLPDAAITECESLLDRGNHNDPGGLVRESDGGVVKARNTSMTATVPSARLAPSSRLWMEIFILGSDSVART